MLTAKKTTKKRMLLTSVLTSSMIASMFLALPTAAQQGTAVSSYEADVRIPSPIMTMDFGQGEEVIFHAEEEIANPFAGLELAEDAEYVDVDGNGTMQPKWTKGVSISYWVYASDGIDSNGQITGVGSDSVLFTFENTEQEEKYSLDDYVKYEAVKDYGKFEQYDESLYDLGNEEQLINKETGEVYTLRSGYGPLIRCNPNYDGSALKEYYFRDDTSTATPDVSWTSQGRKQVKLYKIGDSLVSGYGTLDIDEGSLVRRGRLEGSLQIAASNTFHFKEDAYAARRAVYDEDGWIVGFWEKGAIQTNPNVSSYGMLQQFRHYNQYMFDGDGTVLEAPDQWHFVTCTIMNDWVQFYVDGNKITVDELGYFGQSFGISNADKYFNKGTGMRYPYNSPEVTAWSADGTAKATPANSMAQTMLEWISDSDTKLYLGKQGVAADCINQEIGVSEGVMIDELSFFDVPLNEEQAQSLYVAVKEEKQDNQETRHYGDVNHDTIVNAADALLILQHAAGVEKLTGDLTLALADATEDGHINAADALCVLNVAAGIEEAKVYVVSD